jgi:signal transduction histidine kinase
MRGKSLRLRLALAAAISIILALVVAGVGLTTLFERHAERRIWAELDSYQRQLAAEIGFTAGDLLQLGREPSESRFEQPLSGLYWQIDVEKAPPVMRSRSLWDHVIEPPQTGADRGAAHHYISNGPSGQTLMISERYVDYDDADHLHVDHLHHVRILVAIDRSEVLKARSAFAGEMAKSLALLAVMLMIAAWWQIDIGLRPLDAVHRAVIAIRRGELKRIEVDRPDEVMPLVNEVNSLLDAQVLAIERARSRATDLAHGLKTPLTVLMADAERLRQTGDTALALEIEYLIRGMRRHIERELSRAHLLARPRYPTTATPVGPVIEGLSRTLSRSPKGEPLRWLIDVPPLCTAAIPSDDLSELLGNILDNAVKWASHEIRISATPGTDLVLVIEDDGPGVTEVELQHLGHRGVRLDEAVEGTGFGLAIAGEIAEAYGIIIGYANSQPHGFRVTVRQPPI